MKTDPVDSPASRLVVRASSSVEDRQLVAGWLEAEHFLGALRAVGHTLMQFVQQENQVVAVLVWAASACLRFRRARSTVIAPGEPIPCQPNDPCGTSCKSSCTGSPVGFMVRSGVALMWGDGARWSLACSAWGEVG